jgi:glycosyltransferase involved in cell wall biosynthesis
MTEPLRSDTDARVAVVTWTAHHRTDCLARMLQARLYEPSPIWGSAPVPLRYAVQGLRTIGFLLLHRPAIVVFQNPPSILGAMLVLIGGLLDFDVWADTHSGVFNDPKWSRFARMNRFVFRKSAGVIIHTPVLAARIRAEGGRPFILAYPVTDPAPPARGEQSWIVVTLCYASDEPVELILRAARAAPNMRLVCTGAAPAWLRSQAPANCRFSGWLSRAAYEQLLSGACGVVCLTTRDETMQQGGFEAVEHGLPLITSDSQALRAFHREGAIFVNCSDAEQLSAALDELWTPASRLREGAIRQRERLLADTRVECELVRRAMGLAPDQAR